MAKKTPLTFLERIADVRGRASLKFDAKNDHFKNKYITLAGVLEALDPLLDEHGLILIQRPSTQGGLFGIETVIRETRPLMDEDGVHVFDPKDHPNFVTGFWPVEVTSNPQKIASATTYARRYSVLCCLAIVAGDADDDGNEAADLGSGSMFDRMRGVK